MRPFVDAERVRRIDEGNGEALPRLRRDGGGVREMRVDHIRQARQARQMRAERLDKGRHILGQCILFEVAPIAGRNPIDGQTGPKPFGNQGMLRCQTVTFEQPSDDGDLICINIIGLCGGCIKNISNMSARVGGDAIMDRW